MVILSVIIRVRPRLFDQVGHETMYASSGNKHFFTKSRHRQTYKNYEQSRQKYGTFLVNKVLQKFSLIKVGLLIKYFSKNFFWKDLTNFQH